MHPSKSNNARRQAFGLLLLTPLAACAASDRALQVSEVAGALGGAGIALAELRAGSDASFAGFDADGDGMITEAEFGQGGAGAGIHTAGERAFVFMQRGGGSDERDVDLREGTAAIRAFQFETSGVSAPSDADAFARMDQDGDGFLSLEEYAQRSPRLALPQEALELEIEVDAAAEAFAGFDSNEDGVITRDEWPSPERHLAELDLDGDGFLGLEELAPGEHPHIVIERGEPIPE